MNQLIQSFTPQSPSARTKTAPRRPRRGLVSTRKPRRTVSRTGPDRAHLLGEDLLGRGALVVACDLALGSVPLGNREPFGRSELLRDRAHPLDELLEPGPRRHRLAAVEVDQLAGEAVPDRAPEVLLQQPVRQVGQRLALVERAGDPRRQRVGERGERARLAELGLRVADPDLDGREGEVRPDAPPKLRVLGDRAGLVEEADVALPLRPRAEGVRNPAAREHAREDLRARRVEIGEDAFHERRAGREGEQLGQVVAERRADAARAIRAVDPDVHVEAEAVVAPDDVAEDLVVAAVVRRVDDALLLPGAPRVRAHGGEPDPERLRQRAQLLAPLADERCGLREGVAAAGAHLGLGGDQLADDVLLELRPLGGRLELLEAVDEVERVGIEERELLLDRDGEVGNLLEARARLREHLVVAEPLLVAHARSLLTQLKRAPRWPARPRAGAPASARARPARSAARA